MYLNYAIFKKRLFALSVGLFNIKIFSGLSSISTFNMSELIKYVCQTFLELVYHFHKTHILQFFFNKSLQYICQYFICR